MRAYSLIRREPHYRREAFSAGLRAAGYQLTEGMPSKIEHGDVLLIWNRYSETHELANRFDQQGGIVLVAENAYLGLDRQNRQRYAIARDGHNGSGSWCVGSQDRFAQLGITPAAPQSGGKWILVCPNRSFGMPGFIMPINWVADVCTRLKRVTALPIKVRPHPGNNMPKVPLEADLDGAHAVVVWSSSAGVHALVAGIPVVAEAPWWICKGASFAHLKNVDRMQVDVERRRDALHRLAWAQWSVDEIATGEAFVHLLNGPSTLAGGMPGALAG